jgi:hypothetical protein
LELWWKEMGLRANRRMFSSRQSRTCDVRTDGQSRSGGKVDRNEVFSKIKNNMETIRRMFENVV